MPFHPTVDGDAIARLRATVPDLAGVHQAFAGRILAGPCEQGTDRGLCLVAGGSGGVGHGVGAGKSGPPSYSSRPGRTRIGVPSRVAPPPRAAL